MHIADFIYQDSTHIDENIYLPSLKEALDSDLHFESSCEKERKRKERVKQAIVRLAAGGTIKECAQLFCSYDSFYATYKTIVGEPPLATQHRFLFTCAKDLIDNGKTCKEVCDTLEITDGWLRELFRRHLEMSAQEYFLSREK